MRFVLTFGLISGLGDFVYEGARSITGPFLATFGASAALVGFVTGAGEAVALVFRFWSGGLSDRTGRHWAISIAGYALTMVSVPLMAVTWTLWPAAVLVISERFGKAVRTPARDTMLAQASVDIGRGRAFAIHEALDQSGAFVGPLVVAAAIAISGGYRWGFGILVVPGAAALAVIFALRRAVPRPAAYEHAARHATQGSVPSVAFGERALHVALGVALLDRLALVVAVPAARDRDLDLRARAAEVHARRDERQAALGDAAGEALELAAVGQQLARALRLVVLPRGRRVGRDVHVVEPQLAVAQGRVAVLELHRAFAQRLDLGALQDDPALELVEELVAKRRLPVGGDVPRSCLALLALGHAATIDGDRPVKGCEAPEGASQVLA
jgi:hypothetical protein